MSRAGKPCVGRQRLVVHLDRDQRLARVGRIGDPRRREAGGPAVDGPRDDLRRAGLDTGHREDVGEPDARPLRVAHEVAAHLVAHAGDRHVLLDERQLDQLLERQLDLVVDHPEHPQRPAVEADGRRDQRRVDAIELVVGHDDGRQAGNVECGVGTDGRCRVGHRRDLGDRRRDLRRPTLEHPPPEAAADHGERAEPARPDEERTSRRGAGEGPGGRPGRGHQRVEDEDREPRLDTRGHEHQHRRAAGKAERGEQAHRDDGEDHADRDAVVAPGQQPDADADQHDDGEHEHGQGRLVVGAEQGDHEVLGARRREVDDRRAHRGDRGGDARDQAGEQLADGSRRAGHATRRASILMALPSRRCLGSDRRKHAMQLDRLDRAGAGIRLAGGDLAGLDAAENR